MNLNMITIFQIMTGLFWAITYMLIIRQSIRDKAYGMPLAALCANISWEFIFSFIYPHNGIQGIIDIIWLLLDVIILIQYLEFGRREFPKNIKIEYFYLQFLITLILSFTIIIATVKEFNDFDGKYAAFGQNLMMSVLFISLLRKRKNTKGQSIWIAFLKMIGSLIPAIGFYLFYRSSLITILSAGTFLYDLIYLMLLHIFVCKANITCFSSAHISSHDHHCKS